MTENSVRRCTRCGSLEISAGGETLLVLVDGPPCSGHAIPKTYLGGIFDVRKVER